MNKLALFILPLVIACGEEPNQPTVEPPEEVEIADPGPDVVLPVRVIECEGLVSFESGAYFTYHATEFEDGHVDFHGSISVPKGGTYTEASSSDSLIPTDVAYLDGPLFMFPQGYAEFWNVRLYRDSLTPVVRYESATAEQQQWVLNPNLCKHFTFNVVPKEGGQS